MGSQPVAVFAASELQASSCEAPPRAESRRRVVGVPSAGADVSQGEPEVWSCQPGENHWVPPVVHFLTLFSFLGGFPH